MTEYVAQKYFRKIQSKPHYETVSPRRSEFRSIESEHQRVSFDVPAEQTTGEDDAVFLEIPRTDIESLISQLIQTGSFLIFFFVIRPKVQLPRIGRQGSRSNWTGFSRPY